MYKGVNSAVMADLDYDEFKVFEFCLPSLLKTADSFFVWSGLVLGCEAVLAKRASLVP